MGTIRQVTDRVTVGRWLAGYEEWPYWPGRPYAARGDPA